MNVEARKIISNFEQSHKNLTVTLLIDYDSKYFVIEALEDVNSPPFDDPYFAIEKKTGKVVNFSPAYDIEKFIDAVEKRTVYRYEI